MLPVLLAALVTLTPSARGKPKTPAPKAAPAPAPTPAPAPAADSAGIRAEIAAVLQKAEAQVSDLDEDKALAALDTVATRADITAAELAAVQLWRGVALMGLSRQPEAERAFALSRACNAKLEAPGSASPKIRAVLQATAPGTCPVKAAEPAADLDMGMEFTLKTKPAETAASKQAEETLYEGPSDAPAKPRPKPVPAAPATAAEPATAPAAPPPAPAVDGGPNVKAIAGGAVSGAGAVAMLGATLLAVAGLGVLGASFPVWSWGSAQTQVVDYRRGLYAALGMRIGALAALPVAALVLVAGLVIAAGGGGVLAWGLFG